MSTENANAKWPYGYFNEDGSTPPEPSKIKIWGGTAAVIFATLIAAVSCHPGDTASETAEVNEHQVRVDAFLSTPAVQNSGVSNRTAQDIAVRGCNGLHQRKAAGDSANIVAKLVSVTDEINARYPGVSPRSIAAIIGAGSVVYCPEMTDVLKGLS